MKIKINETYKKIVKRYDDIMMDFCHEYNTITNETYSEIINNQQYYDVQGGVTIAWIKKEIQYMYESYFEDGHMNCDIKYESSEGNKMWHNETRRLKRFLDALEQYDDDIVVVEYEEE